MKTVLWTAMVLVLAAGSAGAGPSNGAFRVTADRVNLRARPVRDAEVLAQVGAGTCVEVRALDGEWAQVAVPTNIGVWVSAAFVKAGRVDADRLLVRDGPGANFRDVGVMTRGEPVAALERHGDWIRCSAPSGAVAWVSATFLAPCVPPPAAAGEPAPAQDVPQAASADTGTAAVVQGPGTVGLPAGLHREELAQELAQGSVAEVQGTVDRVPLAFLHCAAYRLVAADGARLYTVCYLRGNDEQMPSLVGRSLQVRGREYRLKAEKAPLVYPDEIKPLPAETAVP